MLPAEMAPSETEAVADGRLQRSVRSRASILDALLALIQEGELLPTGEQVASRAGVGLRTVFRHFEDMESLHAEVAARVDAVVRPLLLETIASGAPVEDRLRALVRQRANAFERLAPFKHSEVLQRWRSRFLKEKHDELIRGLREQLHAVLPEAGALPPARAAALELATSFEAWDRLRVGQGLGRDRAQEAVLTASRALLDAG